MDKSARTRETLVDTALRLFRERGYERTTMRLIAAEAGVSPGNAYYYFAGKDDLVQELYRRIQTEHRERSTPALRRGAPLAENLRTVLHTGLDVMAPYHGFGTTLLAAALAPTSPVSPFATASAAPRDAAVGLMTHTLAVSARPPAGPVAAHLPRLLWLAYLGVTLHWVIDTTPGQARTRTLVDGLAPILAQAIRLSRMPFARALVDDVARLVERLGGPTPAEASS